MTDMPATDNLCPSCHTYMTDEEPRDLVGRCVACLCVDEDEDYLVPVTLTMTFKVPASIRENWLNQIVGAAEVQILEPIAYDDDGSENGFDSFDFKSTTVLHDPIKKEEK